MVKTKGMLLLVSFLVSSPLLLGCRSLLPTPESVVTMTFWGSQECPPVAGTAAIDEQPGRVWAVFGVETTAPETWTRSPGIGGVMCGQKGSLGGPAVSEHRGALVPVTGTEPQDFSGSSLKNGQVPCVICTYRL